MTLNRTMPNTQFLKACNLQTTDHTPIWLMRQAGRYMKEYQAVRKHVKFLDLCKNPELCAEVTLTAREKLSVDAAIIFSDILLIANTLGLEVVFKEPGGPSIINPVRSVKDIDLFKAPDVLNDLSYVFEALKITRKSLPTDISLIGFAGAPFTLACYIIEGGSSTNYNLTKQLMLGDKEFAHKLLTILTDITITYLNEQVKNGADTIQLFDSWVGILSSHNFKELVLPYLIKIRNSIDKSIPFIYFGNGASHLYTQIKNINATVYSIDWRMDLDTAWDILGHDTAIQGNLDPTILLTDFKTIKSEVELIFKLINFRPGFIFNLGHGILPKTPFDNVKYLVDLVHSISK